MYYIYIIRCEDNSLYTGITTDLERRMEEHRDRGEKGAKYTKSHPFKKLEVAFESADRVSASKLEYRIKHLPKSKKEKLCSDPQCFSGLLKDVIDTSEYTVHDNS